MVDCRAVVFGWPVIIWVCHYLGHQDNKNFHYPDLTLSSCQKPPPRLHPVWNVAQQERGTLETDVRLVTCAFVLYVPASALALSFTP